ncbi:competence/damage-inducible protein A [Palleronia sediminis]|uniref:Competence/damage-inducible protein A n=1 Tax=Palleronia sediminis TaxID=2547833 RepID=A0A4R6AD87_9RHOB|nr:competence/damage-inducible protein A [Palleronia sediminis]TDL79356.1 competence/damage-inducible protein A [Palleronia sediminis]
MPNPTAAMLVIGDEILSGRTRDSNAHHLARRLGEHGIDLREIRFVPDDADTIETAARELSARFDHLFTSGGIGPTHDDITADCIAAAGGVPIGVRADARAALQAHYEARGTELNEARLRMARIPEGATLIDNPVSAAPGFSLGNIHVMAGVPSIFAAMLDSVLPRLTHGTPLVSRSVILHRGEGDIAGPLGVLQADFPDLSIGSYPGHVSGTMAVSVVLRGTDAARLDVAVARLSEMFPELAQ